MRLVIAEGPQDLWVNLEAETPEEMMALETCAARGGMDERARREAVETLQRLAERLGYPVGTPVRQQSSSLAADGYLRL